MTEPVIKATVFETLLQPGWTTILWAAVGALGLNLLLFAVMPYLLHPAEVKPDINQVGSQINVIRIKRPETPARRQIEKSPQTPPQQPKSQKPAPAQPLQAKLALPFAVNPRLPAAPNTLTLPILAPATGDNFGLDATFAVSDLDRPLTLLVRMPPIYPLQAKSRGLEGWVRVRFVVKEDGSVGDITIVESEPSGVFEQSVIRCISGWRFRPGTVAGTAVRARAETTIRFELE